jgi:anti-sigma regulatory factor (Ser/Thr protein kinase)
MATIAYLVLDPASGELAYTLAGHPPPLVLSPDGGTRFLEGGRSGPVGVVIGARFAEASDVLGPAETLLVYTDGVVERRDRSLDEGLAVLADAVGAAGGSPEALCDLVVELGSAADDVAVLAARRIDPGGDRLERHVLAVPDSLSAMRRSLGAWLEAAGADEDAAYDVLLAVGEAAANAVEHAYGPGEEEFDLVAELVGGDVHITIADRGRWRPARGENRGRGLALMRELMDHVDVELGDEGTTVRMQRRILPGVGE